MTLDCFVNIVYKTNVIHKVESSPRGRRRQARTEQILATAMRILAEDGLNSLTIHRLAEELDYTVGALYRYFPSKDAILAEIEQTVVTDLGRLIGRAMGHIIIKVKERDLAPSVAALVPLLALAALYRQQPRLWPERYWLVSQNLANPRRLTSDAAEARVTAALMPILDAAADLFEAAARAGALAPGDAGQRTMIFWSVLHGATQLQKLDRLRPGYFELPALVRDAAQTTLCGFGASAARVASAATVAEELIAPLLTTRKRRETR